jgi:acetyl/propionyl-CoA carboxylase alpha subunit
MEMNTRIQVEHAITEMVTGIDLVKAQIRIAAGETLSLRQRDVRPRGQAIECRVYAEDPASNFAPSPGTIERLRLPGGIGIRNDCGVDEGAEVSIHYDPMISKLVAWGTTRAEAVERMRRAVGEYEVRGVATNLPFHRWILEHPRFLAGDFDTNFIAEELRGIDEELDEGAVRAALAAAALATRKREGAARPRTGRKTGGSPWKLAARREGLRG